MKNSARLLIEAAGRKAWREHGEAGESRCPFPMGYQDSRRMWWWTGYLDARTQSHVAVMREGEHDSNCVGR
jgi:hypothetical protein